MVKIFVLSEYSTSPPTQLGGGRIKIDGGPLYDLARVQQLVGDPDGIHLLTRMCINEVHKLFGSDTEAVAALIQALDGRDYIDSEWCENGKSGVAACDAYRIRRAEVVAATSRSTTVEYFLKFAVGKTGKLVLLVSCHLSK
jgi:hypothetical protein